MSKTSEAITSRAFKQGYYCAVANLVALHGAGIEAEETLRAYGKLDFKDISDYDKEKLAPVAKEIRRKIKMMP